MRSETTPPATFRCRFELKALNEPNRPARAINRMVDEAHRGMHKDSRRAWSWR